MTASAAENAEAEVPALHRSVRKGPGSLKEQSMGLIICVMMAEQLPWPNNVWGTAAFTAVAAFARRVSFFFPHQGFGDALE